MLESLCILEGGRIENDTNMLEHVYVVRGGMHWKWCQYPRVSTGL